ncbi:MAG: glucans biosynthesis glucosyltransferase MdoH [Hyphomicrobiaceae bacterium]
MSENTRFSNAASDPFPQNLRAPLNPLAMTEQSLCWRPHASLSVRPRKIARSIGSTFVLTLILVTTLVVTAFFARGLYLALALQNGGTWVHYVFMAIACTLFLWVAFGAANSVAGAATFISGSGFDTIKLPDAGQSLSTKTALLFPIYHEDPERIALTVQQLDAELQANSLLQHFDVFVLSDSRTDDARAHEIATFSALKQNCKVAVHYRYREENTSKKAGNIADWVTRHGGAYSHFVIFDADSQMSADLLARLARAMENNHDTGLIQTVPRLTGAASWFAAANQFANNVYGPAFAAGFAAWQGPSGNYWGHNAIIRTKVFAETAGLPVLRGPRPFGGHIQSHDFVEAALIRRAGWRVDLITSAEDTREEGPPTMVDMAVRDRRWMQGNIQHLAVVTAGGLSAVSRAHLLFGIFAYVSSALWALLLAIGLWLISYDQSRLTAYFSTEKSLFPHWPTFDPDAGLQVLIGTLFVLIIPKIAGAASYIWRQNLSVFQGIGVFGKTALETLVSTLFAPVMMMVHVRGLVEILAGRDSGWATQRRSASRISLLEAFGFHWVHVTIGIVLTAAALSMSLHTAIFMAPVLAGLLLSPIVTSIGSAQRRI